MMKKTMARRLLIEQVRKELLEEIKTHLVGWASSGEIVVTKNSEGWNGYIFIIPDEKYQDLFKVEK